MKKYQQFNLITAETLAFVLGLLYYTYFQGIMEDPSYCIIPPFLFMIILGQLMCVTLTFGFERDGCSEATTTSSVIALITILVALGVLLEIKSKMVSEEEAKVIASKLIDCQKYKNCPNNPCLGEDCKDSTFAFYYNDEQIANAVKKHNKNLLDQEKIEQSKKIAEKADKEADKRKAEELDKKLNTMLK